MSIIEYTGPSNPQEIRKYLMRRTKDEIVHEYLRQWRYSGELEARIAEAEKIINGWIMSPQTTQATWDAIRQLGKWYVEAS